MLFELCLNDTHCAVIKNDVYKQGIKNFLHMQFPLKIKSIEKSSSVN